MIFKIIIVAMLFIIIGSLASAMYHLAKGEGKSSDKVLKSLTWRIGLSVLLFILLLIGQATGLITPHSL
jgi:hypothetical protein